MRIVNSREMGRILGVTSATVVKMAKSGAIPYGRYSKKKREGIRSYYDMSDRGPYRFNVDAVLRAVNLDCLQGDEAAYWEELRKTNDLVMRQNQNLDSQVQYLTRKVEKLESTLKSIKEVLG